MGDEKDSWKVKTLDEILQEKQRKEQEEKAEITLKKCKLCFLSSVFILKGDLISLPHFSIRTTLLR